MAYTKVNKPTGPTYTNVNSYLPLYDDPMVAYDDSNVYYDGINISLYSKISKPSLPSYTKINKPT